MYVGLSGHSSPQYQADSSPIVCVVLALDSWNYCRPDSPTTSQCLPCLASLITRKWNSQHVPPCGKGVNIRWQHLIFFYLCTWFSCIKKIVESCLCWAVGPALQSNSSNCLVLILHMQLGNFDMHLLAYTNCQNI